MDLGDSPHLAGKQMSSSLKERLKRTARHTSSPMVSPLTSKNVSKSHFIVPVSRLSSSVTNCASAMNEENAHNPSTVSNARSLPASLDEIRTCDDKEKLCEMLASLKAVKAEKEEKLRKLKMVQLYHSKHDPDKFEKLIEKWRLTVQEALMKLHEILPEPKPELTELINHLQIEHEIIGYDKDDESFT